MVKTLLVASGTDTATTAGATQYWSCSNCALGRNDTETNKQILFGSPGTLSKLYVRIVANASSASRTVKTRVNAADGTQSVSIGAAATGVFEDSVNSDVIAAGDKVCYQSISTGTGTTTFSIMSNVFDATTSTVSRLSATATSTTASVDFATASATRFNQLAGELTSAVTTESSGQTMFRKPGTLKNLAIFITSNARTTTTTLITRKNGANGALTISIASGVTGWLEDTTNEDAIVAGDEVAARTVSGTGTEIMAVQSISCDFISTADNGICSNGRGGGASISTGVTNYYALSGTPIAEATEVDKRMKLREAFTLSELSINVTANSLTADTTLRLRVNGANGNQLLTIAAAATGFLSDSVNTDIVTAEDDANYQLISGGTGTTIVFRHIAIFTLLIKAGGGAKSFGSSRFQPEGMPPMFG